MCLVCEQLFETKIQHKHQKYCSEKCSRKAERIFGKKQQTDAEYKDRISFGGNKYKVLERDGYQCYICGNKRQLTVHHKDMSGNSDSANNSIDNLITLCRNCHAKIHMLLREPPCYKDISKEKISETLKTAKTVQEAADSLGITRKTLLLKRKQYGLYP